MLMVIDLLSKYLMMTYGKKCLIHLKEKIKIGLNAVKNVTKM